MDLPMTVKIVQIQWSVGTPTTAAEIQRTMTTAAEIQRAMTTAA
ncbi:MAG: hypothetical protein V4722_12210 [Bacteroidota bacterium]